MKEYTRKEVIEKKEVISKVICDVCGKEITEEYFYEVSYSDTTYNFLEEYEYKDICSDECLMSEVMKFIKDKSNNKDIEIEKIKNKTKYL